MQKDWDKNKIYTIANKDVHLWYNRGFQIEALLLSGIHTEEPAGNIALQKILEEGKDNARYANKLGIIPFRNPFCAFKKDKTRLQSLISDKEIDVKLDPTAQLIYVNLKKNNEDFDARDFWKSLKENLKKQNLINLQDLYYILIPNTRTKNDESYNTFLFTNGEIFDFNTGFGTVEAPHLDGLLRVIKENNPRLILDLHEGLGNGFYIYINPYKNISLELGRHLINYMQKLGYKIKDDQRHRKMIEKGIFDLSCINKKGSLDSQIGQEQTLIILESGLDQAIEKRTQAHIDAVNFTISYLKS